MWDPLTLDQGQVEVVLIQFAAEHSKGLALEQHGLLGKTREELQRTALHVCKNTANGLYSQ